MQLFVRDRITLPKHKAHHNGMRFREVNTLMLGKLVWSMQHHQDKLLVQIMRHQYAMSYEFWNQSNTTAC